ncbi:MAG TPA: SRPBCC family protein [Burkholderiales bacterium]|nr:SRPBCC family protein [Burkholderiales bacterium]
MATYTTRRKRGPNTSEQIARGLGWFSIGIGIAQLVAPRAMARLTGVPLPPALTVLCGLRELACGIGILTQPEPRPWVQARVVGDAIDLAVLGGAVLVPGVDQRRAAIAATAVAGVTALDAYCSRELERTGRRPSPRHVIEIVQVDRSPDELYRFWRAFDNLPRVMPHLESVQVLDERHSHWVAMGPARTRLEWDAEIIDDSPGRCLAWRSVEGSPMYNAGSVQFERLPGGGTEVRVEILYDVPPGSLGGALARLFGRGAHEARADLRRFKQLMESQPA